MDKMINTIKTIVVVLIKGLGLIFCVAALAIYKDNDIPAALFSLILGAGIYFLPDLIKKNNKA